ncbi:MAG: hypothetical protein N2643_05365 [Endomicrobia bacterium]|nr:hypothetical protein [Endomicrobiia bacterium]
MIELFLIFTINIFVLSGITLLFFTRNRDRNNKTEPEQKDEQQPYQYEILYAEITHYFESFNKKIFELNQKLGTLTKTEVLKEIDTIQNSIKSLSEKIEKAKTEVVDKKKEVASQINATLLIFSKIRQILKYDYENLSSQKESLLNLLKQQQVEYENIVNNYNNEIENLNRIVEQIKAKCPENVMEKLKINVATKTKILEELQKQYDTLKLSSQEKFEFLDSILQKKSEEIKNIIEKITYEKNTELEMLMNNIEKLKEETRILDTEVKNIVNAIVAQQQEKSSILERLNSELRQLREQQIDLTNLKNREEFLDKEIEKYKKEYENLQNEYKNISQEKAKELKNIEQNLQDKINNIVREAENKKLSYTKEITKLKNRIETLKSRKQKIALIEKRYLENYEKQKVNLENQLKKSKEELEVKKAEIDRIIRRKMLEMEDEYNLLKSQIEKLRDNMNQGLRHFNDSINEMKRRSQIREERIKKDIAKVEEKFTRVIEGLLSNKEEIENEFKTNFANIEQKRREWDIKITAKKEQIDSYKDQIKQIVENIDLIKLDIEKYENEIKTIESKIKDRFDETLLYVAKYKENLIEKFRVLLTKEEEVMKELENPSYIEAKEDIKN